jgi:hypothetical protein
MSTDGSSATSRNCRADTSGRSCVVQPRKRDPGRLYSSESIFRSHMWTAVRFNGSGGVVTSTLKVCEMFDPRNPLESGWRG